MAKDHRLIQFNSRADGFASIYHNARPFFEKLNHGLQLARQFELQGAHIPLIVGQYQQIHATLHVNYAKNFSDETDRVSSAIEDRIGHHQTQAALHQTQATLQQVQDAYANECQLSANLQNTVQEQEGQHKFDQDMIAHIQIKAVGEKAKLEKERDDALAALQTESKERLQLADDNAHLQRVIIDQDKRIARLEEFHEQNVPAKAREEAKEASPTKERADDKSWAAIAKRTQKMRRNQSAPGNVDTTVKARSK